MKVKDLQADQGFDVLELDIVEMEDARSFSKFGRPGRVANATGKDADGDVVKVSLWNEQIDQVDKGDKIMIKNGFVKEWQGEKQVSTGRNGAIEIIKKGPGPAPVPGTEEPAGKETGEDYEEQEDKDGLDIEEEDVE